MRNMVIALVALVLAAGGAFVAAQTGALGNVAGAAATATPLPVVQESDEVVADAVVVPASSAELRFEATGTVTEILVAEGDTVAKDAPLARLDTRALELGVAEAEAAVAQAQANYQRLVDGATAEEIAQAEAQVAQAVATARQANGSVTNQDIAAAQAQLAEAQAQLAELQAGADETDVRSTQASLDQAQVNVQAQRDALSAAKTNAELALARATDGLRQAQAAYGEAKSNWDYVRETGNDPRQPQISGPTGAQDNEVESAQREGYYAAFVQAEAGLKSAETAVAQAQVALDNARQAEVSGIQAAEAQARDAQARMDDLMLGAEENELAAARARVAQATAALEQLRGEERAGTLAAAEAGLSAAQANLARITADPRSTDLAVAQAQVQAAEVALGQAQLALDKATLKAPMAGTVIEINLDVGELLGNTTAAVLMADTDNWQIETDDLTELDIVSVREGAPVRLTFDALPDYELSGTVAAIQGIGKNNDGDIVYKVTVVPEQWDERLRWNMTATVAILP